MSCWSRTCTEQIQDVIVRDGVESGTAEAGAKVCEAPCFVQSFLGLGRDSVLRKPFDKAVLEANKSVPLFLPSPPPCPNFHQITLLKQKIILIEKFQASCNQG